MKDRNKLRFLVIEARLDWQMAENEKSCILKSGKLKEEQLELYSILDKPLYEGLEKDFDAVIIGGTGDYSVVHDRPDFYEPLLNFVRFLYSRSFPILGLCYGHQILAQALGGKAEELDHDKSETGTYTMHLTKEGEEDKVFSGMPSSFPAQEGHHDGVVGMPDDFVRLAFSQNCTWQAMKHKNKPIYSFQFHPELTREDLLKRMNAYAHVYASEPGALEKVTEAVKETHTEIIIENFIDQIVLPSAN